MKDHRLSIYQKIGDIAKQIEALENKKQTNEYRTYVINLGQIEGKENIDQVIQFHWKRIGFLESLLNKSRFQLRKEEDKLYDNLCKDCRLSEGVPCEEDFLTYNLYKLFEVII